MFVFLKYICFSVKAALMSPLTLPSFLWFCCSSSLLPCALQRTVREVRGVTFLIFSLLFSPSCPISVFLLSSPPLLYWVLFLFAWCNALHYSVFILYLSFTLPANLYSELHGLFFSSCYCLFCRQWVSIHQFWANFQFVHKIPKQKLGTFLKQTNDTNIFIFFVGRKWKSRCISDRR